MRELTKQEQNIVNSLNRLGKKWPQHLILVSDSGALELRDLSNGTYEKKDTIANIYGIINDGGDTE